MEKHQEVHNCPLLPSDLSILEGKGTFCILKCLQKIIPEVVTRDL